MEKDTKKLDRPHVLAWAGWRMRIDPDWRPLGIDDTGSRGNMVVGTFEKALMSIDWHDVDPGRFKPERWLKRHLGAGAVKRSAPSGISLSGGLSELVWIADDGSHAKKCIWVGYHAAAGMVLQIVLNLTHAASLKRRFTDTMLPSVSVSLPGAGTLWSIFDAAFTAPAGYRMVKRRLKVGDLSMQFRGPAGEHLTMRQIFPAATALERRELGRWLTVPVFKSRYRYANGAPEPWSAGAGIRNLTGLVRTGYKKLPWPLGYAFKRGCRGTVVHDEQADRLLSVELEGKTMPDELRLRELLSGMNRPQEYAA